MIWQLERSKKKKVLARKSKGRQRRQGGEQSGLGNPLHQHLVQGHPRGREQCSILQRFQSELTRALLSLLDHGEPPCPLILEREGTFSKIGELIQAVRDHKSYN